MAGKLSINKVPPCNVKGALSDTDSSMQALFKSQLLFGTLRERLCFFMNQRKFGHEPELKTIKVTSA